MLYWLCPSNLPYYDRLKKSKGVCVLFSEDGKAARQDREKAELLADIFEKAYQKGIDPCEDFYRFACGKWAVNTPEIPLSHEQISPLTKLNDKYERAQRELLASEESSTSQAIMRARSFYRSCVNAEQEWQSKGISGINYVMRKIRIELALGPDENRTPTVL
ncbi:hypothetical protein OSTOST_04019 [Ostertagia ostertagi]